MGCSFLACYFDYGFVQNPLLYGHGTPHLHRNLVLHLSTYQISFLMSKQFHAGMNCNNEENQHLNYGKKVRSVHDVRHTLQYFQHLFDFSHILARLVWSPNILRIRIFLRFFFGFRFLSGFLPEPNFPPIFYGISSTLFLVA